MSLIAKTYNGDTVTSEDGEMIAQCVDTENVFLVHDAKDKGMIYSAR